MARGFQRKYSAVFRVLYPHLMAFASFQEVDAVPIALSYKSKERTRYMKRFLTKINRLIPRATVLRSFQ
jgi:hypothetical protein